MREFKQYDWPRPIRCLVACAIAATVSVLLVTVGCIEPKEPAETQSSEPMVTAPLEILVIDDPGLAEAVERQWKARSETEIRVKQASSADLLASDKQYLPADAVIYPSGLIGELAERRMISPIPRDAVNSPDFGRRDIFDLIRRHEIAWGKEIYAVPFGSPLLMVVYRTDIFEQLDLQPPETWQQYQEIAEHLANLDPATNNTLTTPALEPLADAWASQVLIARAAGYARHRNYLSTFFDRDSMEPLIVSEPFVRALKELVAAQSGDKNLATGTTPADAYRALLDGRCAMAITWPSRMFETGDRESSRVPLAAAELPGSTEVFNPSDGEWESRDDAGQGRVPLLGVAGRIGSVGAASRQPQAALNLLVSLSSPEWSGQVSPFSSATTLYRSTQIEQAEAWTGTGMDATASREYGELVEAVQQRQLSLLSIRLPGRARYLAALDEAVQAAVRGEIEPEASLQQTAKRWQEITAELGNEPQRSAYYESLGR